MRNCIFSSSLDEIRTQDPYHSIDFFQPLFLPGSSCVFTKSQARRSNDNALVKCKNGHVLRKLLGHAHIPRQCAATLNEFHRQHLNRYVNYHRPCLFAQVELDERGRQRRCYRYEDVQTPYEKLKSLSDAEQNLKVSVTIETLDAFAAQYSNNEAADRLRSARKKLIFSIDELQRTQA